MSIPARALATILAGLSLATTASLAADPPVAPAATPELARWAETRDARMAWWRGARFGMFIHWGLPSPACGFCDGSVHPTVPTLDGGPATQSDGAAP
jgi:hypothetical protein